MDPPGKPPVSRRPEVVRARILDAAQAEFMAAGYAGASTNRMLERFGGSKPTMFRHFPTKRALYEAVVARIASRWEQAILVADADGADPAAWLTGFGRRALRWFLGDENLFMGRMAVLEAGAATSAAEIYRSHATVPLEATLAERLAAWTAAGLLASAEPGRDATALLDLVLTGPVSRALYGALPMDERAQARHVAHAVGLFLDGRRPRTQ